MVETGLAVYLQSKKHSLAEEEADSGFSVSDGFVALFPAALALPSAALQLSQ